MRKVTPFPAPQIVTEKLSERPTNLKHLKIQILKLVLRILSRMAYISLAKTKIQKMNASDFFS